MQTGKIEMFEKAEKKIAQKAAQNVRWDYGIQVFFYSSFKGLRGRSHVIKFNLIGKLIIAFSLAVGIADA